MCEVKQQKLEALKAKQEKKASKEAKEYQTLADLTNAIARQGGVWTDDKTIDAKVSLLNGNSDKIDAVYQQLTFQKTVLKAKGRKELFQKTHNKIKYTLEIMITNLKEVIKLNGGEISQNSDTDVQETNDDAVDVKQRIEKEKQLLDMKIKDARLKRLVGHQNKQFLGKVLETPRLLVGKRFIYRQVKADTGDISCESGYW